MTDLAVDESRDFAIAGETVNIAIQGIDPIALRYLCSLVLVLTVGICNLVFILVFILVLFLVLILTTGSATWCVTRTIRSLFPRILQLGSLPLKQHVR